MKFSYRFEDNLITISAYNPSRQMIIFNLPFEYASFDNLHQYIDIKGYKIYSYKSGQQYIKTNDQEITIIYSFKNLPKLELYDDRKYEIPNINMVYTSPTSLIIPYLEEFYVIFSSPIYSLLISGIGIPKRFTYYKFTHGNFSRLLITLDAPFKKYNNVYLSYYKHAINFLKYDPKNNEKNYIVVAKIISDYLKKCYSFFKIKEKINFVIYYDSKLSVNNNGHGGMAFNGGFIYFIVDDINVYGNNTIDLKQHTKKYMYTLLHELYHHFNHLNTDNYELTWFGEGFTEFFSHYFYLSKSKFKQICNKFIEQYYINPYKNTNIKLQTRNAFWHNKFYERLPYDKGFVYALYLYMTYKTRFLKAYKKIIVDIFNGGGPKTLNDMKKAFKFDKQFNNYIVKGKTILIKTKKRIDVKSIDISNIKNIEQYYINIKEKTAVKDGKTIDITGPMITIPFI